MERRQFLGMAVSGAALALAGCAAPFGSRSSYATQVVPPRDFDVATHWADVALQQVRDARVLPPRAAYNFAGPAVAGFLAANAILGLYGDNFGIGQGPRGADPEVAYGAAYAVVASEVFQTPFLGERRAFMARYPDGEAKSLGAAWGRQVGLEIVRRRTHDNSQPNKVDFYLNRWPRRQDALRWTPSGSHYAASPGPPVNDFARGLNPGHGHITPWAMRSAEQFEAPPFYDIASPEFAEDYDLIRTIGGGDSRTRTPDQTEIAIYWEDGPWGVTPPGRFLFIAMQVLQGRGFSFIEKARAYAMIGMGMADSSINAWHNKYKYDVIRPETAIRHRADALPNRDPRIVLQPKWRSVITTPPFPAYTSGHSTFGAVGAELCALLIGTDAVAFSQECPDQVIWPQLRNVTRHFTSLRQSAEENGWSRLYGGVHWRADHEQSMRAGIAIAHHIHDNFFPRLG